MLKPYVCVACEKVILDQAIGLDPSSSGIASLIGLFSKVVIKIQEGSASDIPPNGVAPKDWVVYSAWDTEAGDEKREYVLGAQIFYPDMSPFGDVHKVPIKVEATAKRTQVIMRLNGFPIGQLGSYTVRTWVEEHEKVVVGPLEFMLGVEIIQPAQVAKST